MSLSNPKATNPATRFMQWRGGEDGGGRITYYDKEQEEEIEVSLPFSFIVLDELHTITGFSEKDHSGFWSNEVDNLNKELVVRTKAGIITRGKYADISDEIKSKGAKYAKSVYIAFKDEDGELAIGNLKIAGAAMTAWIDFQKKFDVEKCAVMITDKPKKAKKGSNVYFVPVFEGQKLGDATKKAAVALDEQIQSYLTAYFNRKPETEEQYATSADELNDSDDDDEEELPASKPAKKAAPKKKAAPVEEPEEEDDDDEEETIDLKDVPF
jgi:hypothetical protein